jgi:hypothetical protein
VGIVDGVPVGPAAAGSLPTSPEQANARMLAAHTPLSCVHFIGISTPLSTPSRERVGSLRVFVATEK